MESGRNQAEISGPTVVWLGGFHSDMTGSKAHALALAEGVRGPDVVFTLIRDGDHRLSRPADIARLIAAVEEAAYAPSIASMTDRASAPPSGSLSAQAILARSRPSLSPQS